MAPPILKLDGIVLSFGGTPLLDRAELVAAAGDRIALVGRNGSGKSTLLKIAAGFMDPQDGEVFRHPSATVRYLPQMPDMEAFGSVGAYVEAGLGPADDPHRVTYLLDHLGLSGEERPDEISGGEARRAALARVMAPRPDILLLDEPTNHLDLQTIEWLEEEISRSPSAVIVVSHDRRFLERVSASTVWLDRGRTRRLEKGFAHFEAWRDAILDEEESEQHKLGRQIVREEHWLRYGVTARRKRNMRRLGELQALRSRVRGHRGPEGSARLAAGDAAESGKLVIEARNISKSFGSLTVVRGFSTRIGRGDRVGLVGPNGSGKTTLLKMLTGEIEPDGGSVRLGSNLEIAALDQRRAAVDPGETLAHFLTDGRGETVVVNGEERHVVSYMKDFLFKAEQARTPVRELSGGERARLILARVLSRPANLLVLDEPTNDLDMETLELLQELVAGFSGTVLLVSHDRDFLDRTVTSILAPDGSGMWIEYAGGYSDMLAQRGVTKFEDRRARVRQSDVGAAPGRPTATPASVRKLSFKQKFALEKLPGRMAAASETISALENQIADPAFYERDPASFRKTVAALERERRELALMEDEWLELEMLREDIEG
jgi:ATP-binding cassette subfamily F protein uup